MFACDIGNTQTVFGYFRDDKLLKSFRINTDHKRTTDEYKLLINGLLSEIGAGWQDFKTITLASVVPRVTDEFLRLKEEKELIVVNHKSRLGFSLAVPEAETVGSDRIVNIEGAIHKFSPPLIIIDCGTAVTFDVINSKSEYIGGAIAPGIYTAADALFSHASKLFSTTLERPSKVIGNTTKKSLQSGIIHGWASLIEGMVWKMKKELDSEDMKVIGTGGQIDLVGNILSSLDAIDKDLTLEGLLWVYKNETKENR